MVLQSVLCSAINRWHHEDFVLIVGRRSGGVEATSLRRLLPTSPLFPRRLANVTDLPTSPPFLKSPSIRRRVTDVALPDFAALLDVAGLPDVAVFPDVSIFSTLPPSRRIHRRPSILMSLSIDRLLWTFR